MLGTGSGTGRWMPCLSLCAGACPGWPLGLVWLRLQLHAVLSRAAESRLAAVKLGGWVSAALDSMVCTLHAAEAACWCCRLCGWHGLGCPPGLRSRSLWP